MLVGRRARATRKVLRRQPPEGVPPRLPLAGCSAAATSPRWRVLCVVAAAPWTPGKEKGSSRLIPSGAATAFAMTVEKTWATGNDRQLPKDKILRQLSNTNGVDSAKQNESWLIATYACRSQIIGGTAVRKVIYLMTQM